jgi:hypothetical protein
MSDLEPPYPFILDSLQQGLVIPFLGSGASLGGRDDGVAWECEGDECLPNANELASYLASKMHYPEDEAPELAKVGQYCSIMGGRTSLYRELRPVFNRDYPITPLHEFLADVPKPLLIVTTNYDDLVESALRKKGREYDLVIHTTNPDLGDRIICWQHGRQEPDFVIPNKVDIDLDSVTVIYKMHGTVDRHMAERDQYVITEDDYIDFLVRMTRNKAIPAMFVEPFRTRHFLFLGYSLRDWNLRVVLNRVERDLRLRRGRIRHKDIKSWAIQYKPSALEKRFWQERGVEVFDMKLDDFVKQINSI